MNGDSWASWVAASPPEMFGEPDDCPVCGDVCRCDEEQPSPPVQCPTCGEWEPPCACQLAAEDEARDAEHRHMAAESERGPHYCHACGCEVAYPSLCGECGCEDDGDIY